VAAILDPEVKLEKDVFMSGPFNDFYRYIDFFWAEYAVGEG